jgi:SsrA-binding protein
MKVVNRKFNREYQVQERFEAGISLLGAEVKTIKEGNIKLEDAFVKLLNDGAYLVNAEVPLYKFSPPLGYDPRRSRKLLLHKKEILRVRVKISAGGRLTVVPVSCYNKGRRIKLEIALVKSRGELGKKKYEKQRDIALQQKREAREYMKE